MLKSEGGIISVSATCLLAQIKPVYAFMDLRTATDEQNKSQYREETVVKYYMKCLEHCCVGMFSDLFPSCPLAGSPLT